jgi:hypothetical protein
MNYKHFLQSNCKQFLVCKVNFILFFGVIVQLVLELEGAKVFTYPLKPSMMSILKTNCTITPKKQKNTQCNSKNQLQFNCTFALICLL